MTTKKLPAWGLSRGILCYLEVVSGENQRRLGKLSGVTLMGHSWISYFVNTAAVCLLVIIVAAAFRERKDSQRSPSSTPSKFHDQPYFVLAVKTPSLNLLLSKLVG